MARRRMAWSGESVETVCKLNIKGHRALFGGTVIEIRDYKQFTIEYLCLMVHERTIELLSYLYFIII